ncbi:hypothetical protein GIB67_001788 [Kingdonia uniflora]|uniref:UspA domain-containing protein n=1 Tax=Kingdonia uniflora TaxID=39325 RepID=A0A7J7LBL2_9MAGN|nr:hypothetical protein GIB67_001788 [Kingdonia uniflora]
MTEILKGAKDRKIIVAIDEGEESMYALSWALKNVVTSENSKDTIFLLYVKPPPVIFTTLNETGYIYSSDVVATMEKYRTDVAVCLMDKAKRICKGLKNDVKVETKVGNGDPRDVICEMVEKIGADVLVLGTHGYGLLKRTFLGSVSDYCAHKVKCPVLIVKRLISLEDENKALVL